MKSSISSLKLTGKLIVILIIIFKSGIQIFKCPLHCIAVTGGFKFTQWETTVKVKCTIVKINQLESISLLSQYRFLERRLFVQYARTSYAVGKKGPEKAVRHSGPWFSRPHMPGT